MDLIYTSDKSKAYVSFGTGLRSLVYPAVFTLTFKDPNDLTTAELVPHPPAPWNGPEDGLPPVGLEVEIRLRNKPDWSNWCRAKILFCKDGALVFEWAAEGVAHPVNLEQCEIRPIRTAERLAAEARDRFVSTAYQELNIKPDVAERMYAKGYRKVEQP